MTLVGTNSLYCEATAGNTKLHASRAHPQPLIRSIPFSQYLRIRCNCSDDPAFQMKANNLMDRLLQRGYSLICLKKGQQESHQTF